MEAQEAERYWQAGNSAGLGGNATGHFHGVFGNKVWICEIKRRYTVLDYFCYKKERTEERVSI